MKFTISKSGLLLAAAITVLGGQSAYALAFQQAPAEAQDADSVILDRQLIMQQIEKDSDTLGQIVAGLKPKSELVATSQSVAKAAKEARDSFKPKVPGGGSKPEIWTNWDDFSKRMDVFVTKSEEMAKVSETGDLSKVGELMVEALQCKQCHDLYRVKKTS